MSLETFVRAMPKVDLHVHLEGALQKETLLLISEQNDIPSTMKAREYREQLEHMERPDPKKFDDIARNHANWIRYPEDLTRVVYDLGVMLHKQSVRYAEVFVSAALYTDNGLSFDGMLEGLNDGRDRVLRGWQVTMNWILTIPRDRPRKSDDIVRWVTSATARKGHVIGLGISGREDTQTADQFGKAFTTVQKKDIPTVAPAHSHPNAETVTQVVDELAPQRITDTLGLAEDAESLATLASHNIPLVVTPTRDLRLGRLARYQDYPITRLLSEVTVSLASGMPSLYRTTLNDEYLHMANAHGLDASQLKELALNGVRASFLPATEKEEMLRGFEAEIAELESTIAF